MNQFNIGDRVKKAAGDYQISGETRLVVEHNAEGGGSFLHIYGAANLEVIGENPAQDERDVVATVRLVPGTDWKSLDFAGDFSLQAQEVGTKLYLHPAQTDPWKPSGKDYDRAIHLNPDAKAWADLFVETFPGLADKHDLMIGWFANAMMAMHDHLARKTTTTQVGSEQ